jgi:archaellum component FlaG (FlaF/FlaG flagellin family)
MPLWQRLVLTIVAIIVASFLAGLIWHQSFTLVTGVRIRFGLPETK